MKTLDKPNWQRQKERSKRFWMIGLMLFMIIPVCAASAYMLRNVLGQTLSFSGGVFQKSGSTIAVASGGDFQAALDRAAPGDTISLEAGAEFKGNFNLPKKNGEDFITIRSSAADAELPAEYTRIDPKKYASLLPKLSSPNGDPVLSAFDGAHHYRFVAVEFGGTEGGNGNIIKIGSGEEKRIEDLPHHIEFDRIYLHATSPDGQRRGVAANGKNIKISNSYFEGIRRKGDESQAIAVWATDGPVEITNNYLEGAAENILFGGGSSYLKLTPTDCLVRDNHLNKPLEWRSDDWVVKNLFEIKDGIRIKVENNLMTNNWANGQDATAVLFSTRDSGHPVIIKDVVFVNNVIRGSGNGISVYGLEGRGGHNLTIRNNIFEDISGEKWGGRGFFMKSSAWDGLVIENNTIINSGHIANAYDSPVKGLVFRNNIVFEGEYGFKGDGTPAGRETLAKFFPGGQISNNVIIGGSDASYRGNNFFPSSIRQVGFDETAARKYLLVKDSPYTKRGSDGKQVGAELDLTRVGTGNP